MDSSAVQTTFGFHRRGMVIDDLSRLDVSYAPVWDALWVAVNLVKRWESGAILYRRK